MISARTSESPVEFLMEQERQERMEAGVAEALTQLPNREQFILSRRFRLMNRKTVLSVATVSTRPSS